MKSIKLLLQHLYYKPSNSKVMNNSNLTQLGRNAMNRLIGVENKIIQHHQALESLAEMIAKSISIKPSQPVQQGTYRFNKTICDVKSSLTNQETENTNNAIIIDPVVSKPNMDAVLFEFILAYAYIYIDMIINIETVNNLNIPCSYVVFGTKTLEPDLNQSKKHILKPLVKFMVNPHNKTIISPNNDPAKSWTFDDIDDFLWITLDDIWKDAFTWNNRNFLP